MNTFELIKEPIFWIVSAFGSVALSILANLMTPLASTFLSKFSLKRKIKLESKRLALLNEVKYVSSDQNRILNYKVDAAYWLLRIICLLLFGIMIFSTSSIFGAFYIIPLTLATIMIVRSSQWMDVALKKYKIARLASERAETIREFKSEWHHEDYFDKDTPDPFNDDLTAMLKEWDKANINSKV